MWIHHLKFRHFLCKLVRLGVEKEEPCHPYVSNGRPVSTGGYELKNKSFGLKLKYFLLFTILTLQNTYHTETLYLLT